MNISIKDIAQMGIDLYRGSVGNFSTKDVEKNFREALNTMIAEKVGEQSSFASLTWRKKTQALEATFEVIEEVLPILLSEGIKSQFDELVDVRNLNFGDTNAFEIEDYHLFNVSTVAAGTNNIRRQRQDSSTLYVPTAWKEIKLYEELEKFLAGRVDWNKLIDKAIRSMEASIKADIYNAIVAAYSSLATPYKYNGVFDRTQFNTLVQHIEAITSRPATVFGTKLALQQATPAYVSYNMMDQRNEAGFFRVIDGIQMVEIPQAIAPGTDNFAIGDNFLLVVPTLDEKILKLVLEGQPLVYQNTGVGENSQPNADSTMEWIYKEKVGVGLVTSTRFGAYIFS